MEKAENISKAMINTSIEDAVKSFIVEHDDELTNKVREDLDSLSEEELNKIKTFLSHLLNVTYDYKLYEEEKDSEDGLIKNLSENELFLFKETIIYFLGRLKVSTPLDVLKKAYELDDNKYIKLNLMFASLSSFDETIEMDFVSKIKPGNEYDEMIRSWTMAFFTHAKDPYNHKDLETDDWTPAKNPRIKRLNINDETNPKFKKAMSFRLMDFLVIYLFLENRKVSDLTDEEKEIIKNAFIEYKEFSNEKIEKIKDYQKSILSK